MFEQESFSRFILIFIAGITIIFSLVISSICLLQHGEIREKEWREQEQSDRAKPALGYHLFYFSK